MASHVKHVPYNWDDDARRGTVSLRSVAFVAVLGSLIGGLTACSGKDELSFEDWQSQVSAVCDEYEPKQDAVVAEHGEIADAAAFEAFMVDYIPIGVKYTDATVAVGVPTERRDEVEALYADIKASEDVAKELLAAVRLADMAAFESLSDDLGERDENVDALIKELDIPACA